MYNLNKEEILIVDGAGSEDADNSYWRIRYPMPRPVVRPPFESGKWVVATPY
ncbi:hypothetical protein [Photobacterium leiognathi]|uniref:hypothetical protein n=1 Tax=Photobacterium leiognathi TaxID=553611 RepID=UPI0029828FC4|nr:hypothetical protein [Photobacterium leiognathi]